MDPTVISALTLSLALLFAGSAAMKLVDLPAFAAAVENYRILPESLAAPFAWMVPALELVGGLGLVAARTRLPAAAILSALLVMFTAAILINLARGRRDVDCGCFGPAMRQTLSGWLVVRNALLLAATALAALPSGGRPLVALDVITVAFAVPTILALYLASNFLIANGPAQRALENIGA